MQYKSYLLKIVGPGVNEYPNKHLPDDEQALGFAGLIVKRYPKGTKITVYRVEDIDGRETKIDIGRVEH